MNKLKELHSQDNTFSFTPIITGPFFDWGMKMKLIVNFAGPSTPIYDGGDTLFSTTTLAGIGKAVVGILRHPEETKNRYVYVSQANITQNKIIEWAGKSDQLVREHKQTIDLERKAYEPLERTPPDVRAVGGNFIRRAIYHPSYGCLFPQVDNDLLGLPTFSESEIIDLVKQCSS